VTGEGPRPRHRFSITPICGISMVVARTWEEMIMGPMRHALLLTLGLLLTSGPGAWAQAPAPAASDAPAAPNAPAASDAPAAAAAEPAADQPAGPALLTDEELDALVAPVALYPDALLVLVLQASTLPIEIVQASRFLEKHATDSSLAPDPGWDSSVTGLLNYPTVVALMSDDLDWTQDLGDAVINQLGDLQDSVQQVRAELQAAGALATNDKQVVVTTADAIKIEPADPNIIYVPVYQPVPVAAAAPVAAMTGQAPAASASPEAYAAAPAPAYPAAPAAYPAPAYPAPVTYAAPAVTYSDPYPSFWTNAASFAGGAVLGGLLGYAIGDDNDNDNDCCWNGNNNNWNGNGGGAYRSGNDVNIEGNNVFVGGNHDRTDIARNNELTQNALRNRKTGVSQTRQTNAAANARSRLQTQSATGARAATRPAAGTTSGSGQGAGNAAAARQAVGATGATRPNAGAATRPTARPGDRPAAGKGGGALSSVAPQRQVAREADRGGRSRASATQARPPASQSIQSRAPSRPQAGSAAGFAPRDGGGRAGARGHQSRGGRGR
jgi:hypothetical protein